MSCIYDDNALCDLILVEDGVFDFGGVSGETGLDLRGCQRRGRVKSQGAETQVATLAPGPNMSDFVYSTVR